MLSIIQDYLGLSTPLFAYSKLLSHHHIVEIGVSLEASRRGFTIAITRSRIDEPGRDCHDFSAEHPPSFVATRNSHLLVSHEFREDHGIADTVTVVITKHDVLGFHRENAFQNNAATDATRPMSAIVNTVQIFGRRVDGSLNTSNAMNVVAPHDYTRPERNPHYGTSYPSCNHSYKLHILLP